MMTLKKILGCLATDLVIVIICSVLVNGMDLFHGDLQHSDAHSAEAESPVGDVVTYPYTKTFTISAYYSPLPCQDRYTTGSYEGDIRLNGNGTNGADGTEVYPGMIAAPKNYPFGTKLYIPNIGTVAVHDRGGAILNYDGSNGVYDRLDIWMGWGDKGLTRALNWGKRNVDVTVYGINSGIEENIFLTDFSTAEAIPNDCYVSFSEEEPELPDVGGTAASINVTEPQVETAEVVEPVVEIDVELTDPIDSDLELASSGEAVSQLQRELASLNFYKGDITGYYGELTEHAVFKFQQSQMLVGDRSSLGAGVFGPKTRDRLNEILSSRNYTKTAVAVATLEGPKPFEKVMLAVEEAPEDISFSDGFEEEEYIDTSYVVAFTSEMDFGLVDEDVRRLQEVLKAHGYFEGLLTTNYFGPQTEAALIQFQLDNGLISDTDSVGAGRVGPATLQALNALS